MHPNALTLTRVHLCISTIDNSLVFRLGTLLDAGRMLWASFSSPLFSSSPSSCRKARLQNTSNVVQEPILLILMLKGSDPFNKKNKPRPRESMSNVTSSHVKNPVTNHNVLSLSATHKWDLISRARSIQIDMQLGEANRAANLDWKYRPSKTPYETLQVIGIQTQHVFLNRIPGTALTNLRLTVLKSCWFELAQWVVQKDTKHPNNQIQRYPTGC